MTGAHGVRFQYDYRHDVAGSRDRLPRWLRLTRSGDTITSASSTTSPSRAATATGSVNPSVR
ncbi:hypothetical protein ACIBQ6_12560 [Nonomuraea sp. NPDC049655]|uniref:hypothetical protein n=1 Tax=Nonomuraea sp. NPDC049655 TaxID=3364355 RepID=UPI003797791A